MTDSLQGIRQQASHWLVELETAPDLDAIWPDFEAWLDQDPEHKRVYENMETAWRDAAELISRATPAQINRYFDGLRRRKRIKRIALIIASVLAVLAVVVTIARL